MLENLTQDLKFAVRVLSARKFFTAVVIATLGLGIGANTAIFSVVNGVLLRPLPYPDPDRLVQVWATRVKEGELNLSLSYLDFLDLKEANQTLEGMAAHTSWSPTLTGIDHPQRLMGRAASPGFFAVMGVDPVLGRSFRSEEGQAGRGRSVIISHSAWSAHFGLDPDVLARKMRLDGVEYQIVGVLPPGFRLQSQVAVWRPLREDDSYNNDRSTLHLDVVARLKPAVSLSRAEADLKEIARRLEGEYPVSNEGRNLRLEPLQEALVGSYRSSLLLLLGAVGLLLLIACANVSHMLLIRTTEREREIALRTTLGAAPIRIVRQLLMESLMLALAGGALGLLIAYLSIPFLLQLSPVGLPRADEVGINQSVLLFALLLSALTALLFGLTPAVNSLRFQLSQALNSSARGSVGAGTSLRQLLVVTEFALAFVLLVGAGLLLNSFLRIQAVDTGFRPDHLLAARMTLTFGHLRDEAFEGFYDLLLEKAQALPGVESAAFVSPLPFNGDLIQLQISFPDRPDDTQKHRGHFRVVSPGYFETMGIPLIQGRLFNRSDTSETPRVIVLNKSLAERYWPGENPLGKRITVHFGGLTCEVIGVVGDVKHQSLREESGSEYYLSNLQVPWPYLELVARTGGNPMDLAPALRRVLMEVNPDVAFSAIRPVNQLLSDSLSEPRFGAFTMALFALLALALSLVGIYGVVSLTVSQRSREIGVRMALGATPGGMLREVVGKGFALALTGVLIGLACSFPLMRLLASQLFEVSSTDPLTIALVALLLLGTAGLASLFPARRVVLLDPTDTLRAE